MDWHVSLARKKSTQAAGTRQSNLHAHGKTEHKFSIAWVLFGMSSDSASEGEANALRS